GTFGWDWLTWWLGDAAGAVIVAPVLLLWALERKIDWSPRDALERAVFISVLSVVAWVVFGQALVPLGFLCFPVLLWPALRFGRRETATAILVLAVVAFAGTLSGSGPFARQASHKSVLLLQSFLGVISVMSVTLATDVFERKNAAVALKRREKELNLVTSAL